MRLLFLLISPYLIFLTPALAKTVVLKAPQASAKDYQAFVLSSPTYEFPSRVVLSAMPSMEDREHLSSLFAKAQTSYTDGSLNQAKEDFRQVIALAETDQWGEEEQSVLLHSYFRLAQLAKSADETDDWIRKALIWSAQGQLDESLFPPPLVERFREMKNRFTKVEIDVRPFAEDFNYLVINGQNIDLAKAKKIEMNQGPARVTFVSDTYQPTTLQLLTVDQMAQVQPEKRAWVEGSCVKPQMHWQRPGEIAKPFFNQNCAPVKPKDSPEIDVAYHAPTASAHTESSPVPLTADVSQSTKSHVPFYERSWFWIGVGVAAAAIVTVSVANSHSSNHPTSTSDF